MRWTGQSPSLAIDPDGLDSLFMIEPAQTLEASFMRRARHNFQNARTTAKNDTQGAAVVPWDTVIPQGRKVIILDPLAAIVLWS